MIAAAAAASKPNGLIGRNNLVGYNGLVGFIGHGLVGVVNHSGFIGLVSLAGVIGLSSCSIEVAHNMVVFYSSIVGQPLSQVSHIFRM